MKIKFNSIQDLSDARYASAMMAEWIGFETGTENALPIAQIQEIIGWINGPKILMEIPSQFEVDLNQLLSWTDVLPISGFECSENVFKNFNTHEAFANFDWIIMEPTAIENPSSNVYYHINNSNASANSKVILKLQKNQDYELHELEKYAGISIDCEPAENPALKNYDHWNNFFEKIELI